MESAYYIKFIDFVNKHSFSDLTNVVVHERLFGNEASKAIIKQVKFMYVRI